MSICFLFWICLKPCDQHLASYCKTVFKPNDCFMSSQVFVGFCFHICLTFASVNIPFKFHWFCIFSRLQCLIKKNGILLLLCPWWHLVPRIILIRITMSPNFGEIVIQTQNPMPSRVTKGGPHASNFGATSEKHQIW